MNFQSVGILRTVFGAKMISQLFYHIPLLITCHTTQLSHSIKSAPTYGGTISLVLYNS
jgi:hypothetical protein